MRLPRRLVVAGVVGTVLLGLSGAAPGIAGPPRGTPANAAPPAGVAPLAGVAPPARVAQPAGAAPPARVAPAGADRTTAAEARRVDRVPTPRLDWYGCDDSAECATVRLPLDYDDPHGATTEIALLRIPARDQRHRIGSLFVNPGGPGGSGTELARYAPFLFSDAVLDRFDVVGVDPRGVGASEQLRCFPSVREQTRAYAGLAVPFPLGAAEERAWVASSQAIGRGCAGTGRRLAGAMSTAEVARDLDVLRRAVGDQKLSYLGFSYGSILGQYYANMFPDRVRALVVDGVLDPRAWVGDRAAPDLLQDDRLRSADGSYRALREILNRCGRAGPRRCELAAAGDPVANYDLVARRLRAKPLVLTDPDGGRTVVSYAMFVMATLFDLWTPDGYDDLVETVRQLLVLTDPKRAAAARTARPASELARLLAPAPAAVPAGPAAGPGRIPRFDFPYDDSIEAASAVTCTDAVHPARAQDWPRLTARADERAAYFGRAWSWGTAICAGTTWTVRDEDAYTGPFNRWTAAPVLVVGGYWDPATNYAGAVSAAALLPNSRLLSSDSWGHTSYGTSHCVTGSVDAYLLSLTLPAEGTVCVGDIQPFAADPTDPADRADAAGAAAAGRSGRTG
ncbi:alpha/beta hydrolase [Plantactinospora sp. KBS50]|uniref:alpha/beta hydrolase n=1 Tax=Plantactinospora sp. KBS50 TaxID=2024580 RepID=UPI000BAADADE|nr:alpha/beta hydrolase [Plantactinospora sp. KBS50]ASW57049.1 peptidase S33 family protein [Plantactinospora sp. KBS50]